MHVYLNEIQHAANAAVGGDALVLAKFALTRLVHIDRIPVVPRGRSSDDATGPTISNQFHWARGTVAVAVGLLLQDQDRVGMNRIDSAVDRSIRPTREAELQPFRRNRCVGPASVPYLDAKITVEKIPRLHGRCRCAGGRG